MCVVCVLWEQDKLTKEEVIQAGMERIGTERLSPEDEEHMRDVINHALDLIDNEEYDELHGYTD